MNKSENKNRRDTARQSVPGSGLFADTSRYADIIGLQRPVSATRRLMSMADRAAQFSAFAALSGHNAALESTVRQVVESFSRHDDAGDDAVDGC